MADGLDEAVAEAKVAAGLEPSRKYPAHMFHEFIEERWQRPFWERALDQFFAAELQPPVTPTENGENTHA